MVESIQTAVDAYAVEQKEIFALKGKETTVSGAEKRTVDGDTVSISDEAKTLSEQMKGGEAAQDGVTSEDDEYKKAIKAEESPSGAADTSQSTIETLQKRIKELQKELRKAQEELERAKNSEGNSGEGTEGGNSKVEVAQAKVQMINAELVQCQAELAEAMKQGG